MHLHLHRRGGMVVCHIGDAAELCSARMAYCSSMDFKELGEAGADASAALPTQPNK